ncbi:hypothetical protein TWF694_000201 [Orbilia ellipsospora]|uniref:Ankyrin repeat protein n=1 Tax=Orbilia ellipsospora TaxID=2528407 RepID=A0AAV9XMX2_9PEZI
MLKRKHSNSSTPPDSKRVECDTAASQDNPLVGDYTVGWICALQVEYETACEMLDDEFDDPEDSEAADENIYKFGRINGHYVVVACLPLGQYGTNSAACVARDMARSFPNLRFVLMVGIGGGAPGVGRDIRLGDVVVSKPSDQFGGVVQYDLGKQQTDYFERTGQLNSPPKVLLGVLSEMQRRYNSPKFSDGIANHLKRMDGWQGYERPTEDLLYCSNFQDHDKSGCDQCGLGGIVPRRERATHRAVTVHYGTIASGNSVIKDARIRDRLADEHKLLCFEMEAAGLMNNVPCLVIRGICDYADSQKNDNWHKYAALTAAAYARELLCVLKPKKVDSIPLWAERIDAGLSDLTGKVVDIKDTTESLKLDSQYSKIKKWLSPPDPSTNFTKARSKWYEGTGSWFLESNQFDEWRSRSRQHLWLHGIPGCGKTILSAAIIHYLQVQAQRNSSEAILNFFFDFNDIEKQKADNMIRAFALQLCPYESSRRILEELYSTCKNGAEQPSSQSLLDCLRKMLRCLNRVCIIIDALDECTTRKDLFNFMKSLASFETKAVSFVLTSRDEPDINQALKSWIDETNFVPVQESCVDKDICLYVRGVLAKGGELHQRWGNDPSILEEIETGITKSANGMFRLAACQIESLEGCLNLGELRITLATLPTTLYETYSRILAKISRYKKEAICILQFLTYSKRPLTLAEAVDAIAVHLDQNPVFRPEFRMQVAEEITMICPSLISLASLKIEDAITTGLQLAHFSVKEYLLSSEVELGFKNAMREVDARASITETCLAYLGHLSYVDRKAPDEIKRAFPLTLYSAKYWMEHARHAEIQVLDSILAFFAGQRQVYTLWARLFEPWEFKNSEGPSAGEDAAPPLYYASLAGLKNTVQSLIDKGVDFSVWDSRRRSVLWAATYSGNEVIVEMLLNERACIDANVFQTACREGYEKIVKLLLNKRADPSNEDFYIACDKGYEKIVKLLLDKGVYISSNCITAASRGGYEKIVKMLLDRGVKASDNALLVACKRGYEKIVQMLLDRGVDASSHALDVASWLGHKKIVQMLLDKGAEALSGSPLQAACFEGDEKGVQILLDKGANVNAKGGFHGCALKISYRKGYEKIVRMLLDKGADANTALNLAFYSGNEGIIQILLEKGAHPKNSHFVIACQKGYERIVEILLDRGESINERDMLGETGLLVACRNGEEKIVEILLDRGADVNLLDEYQRSALWNASERGYEKIVRTLIKNGADVNAKDKHGETTLGIALKMGHERVAQMLIDKGADINKGNVFDGRTTRIACKKSFEKMIQFMLDKAIYVDSDFLETVFQHDDYERIAQMILDKKPNLGGKLLIAACQNGNETMVHLLLEKGIDASGGALRAASRQGYQRVVQILLDKGAEINAGDTENASILQIASWEGFTCLVGFLLDRGADINAQSKNYGNTLQAASQRGYTDIVIMLLDRKADVNAQTQGVEFGNALQAASARGHRDIVLLLLERGADIYAQGGKYCDAMQAATQNGCTHIVDVLKSGISREVEDLVNSDLV